MSGYNEIMDWAEENYPFEGYDSFDEWAGVVSADFEDSGRLPLSDIFDSQDWEDANYEFLYSKQY